MNTPSSWLELVLAAHVHTQPQTSLQIKSAPVREESLRLNQSGLNIGCGIYYRDGDGGRNNPTAGLFLDLLRVAESKLLVL